MKDERCEHFRFDKRTAYYSGETVPAAASMATQIAVIGPEGCPECLSGRLAIVRDVLYALSCLVLQGPEDAIQQHRRRLAAKDALELVYRDRSVWMYPDFKPIPLTRAPTP